MCSAADSQAEIPAMAREAILAIVEEMVISGAHSVDDIHDEGCLTYSANQIITTVMIAGFG